MSCSGYRDGISKPTTTSQIFSVTGRFESSTPKILLSLIQAASILASCNIAHSANGRTTTANEDRLNNHVAEM
jgi:hypothetical protein